MGHVNIIIVDDVKMTRLGLAFLLNRNSDYEIIGEAENGRFFLQLLETKKPDIVLMDINMPMLNGIEATKEAIRLYPNIKILALTNDDGELYIDDMTSAGAKGFLMKNTDAEEIQRAITTIMNGGTYIAPHLISYYNIANISRQRKSDIILTRLETDVLNLLCKGLSLREIANRLFVDVSIVETQCDNLSTKTKTRNAVGLVLFAIKNKMVSI